MIERLTIESRDTLNPIVGILAFIIVKVTDKLQSAQCEQLLFMASAHVVTVRES